VFPIVSLLFLVGTIILGFVKKINIGVIAIAAALILGRIAGVPDKEIVNGFGVNLFIILLGVSLLFTIAQNNGTLELLAKKIVALCAKRVFLIPIVIFVLAWGLAAIGPGGISVSALMSVVCVSLALQMQIAPIKLVPFGMLGALAGGLSPIAQAGVIANDLAKAAGYQNTELGIFFGTLVAIGTFCVVFFFATGWHKPVGSAVKHENLPAFTWKQYATLAGILLLAVMIMAFNCNIGLAAILIAAVLILIGAGDGNQALKDLSWGTLLLVFGVGILMNLVSILGGIDLLASVLASMMTKSTAVSIMGVSAGVLSWFSSASGVVMPTLIPTVPSIAASVAGVHPIALIVAICVGAHMAALSPLSTCGGFALASYSSIVKATPEQSNKTFRQLFLISALAVLWTALIAFTGLLEII